ncbi:MAG TPA: hypothetical protein VNM48_18690 [Chloroflexota bacterium]|nr:hypothetical protein [Chloroflexota bacterium]
MVYAVEAGIERSEWFTTQQEAAEAANRIRGQGGQPTPEWLVTVRVDQAGLADAAAG